MGNSNFVPPIPHIDPPNKEDFEEIKNYENPKVRQAVKSALDRQKALKHQARKNWWKTNWIGITTLIATLLTLIATIVFGLLQVLG